MSKSAKQIYIDNNDFEGAKERLETTSARWRSYWYEVCEEIFTTCKDWAKKYILNPMTKTISKLMDFKETVPKLRKNNISITENCIIQNNEDKTEKCYLIEFFDSCNNSICSKVGTTIRRVQERIREELNSTTYKKMGAVSCVIHRVYDCGNLPAEGLESYFRAKYIKKYPNSFCKNDRFILTQFDLNEADNIYQEYITA